MSSVYKEVRNALELYLSQTSGIPTVAYDNVKFSPVTGTNHLICRFLPTARFPATRGLNPQYRYQGVLQLLVHTEENKGTAAHQDLVDLLIERFPTGQDITDGTVYVTVDQSEQMGSYNKSPWFVSPINIRWFCYHN